MPTDSGIDGTVLKGQDSIFAHRAVLHVEVLAVAKGLFAGNVTADETQIAAVPGQVFTIDDTILHRHILAVPQGILRVEHAVADNYSTAVLESIVALLMIVLEQHIVGVHTQIVGSIGTRVPDGYVTTVPQSLLRISKAAALYMDALHAAEHLGSIHLAIRHKHIITVPERTACSRLEQAVFHAETIAFPEYILPVESTVAGFYIARLFDSRFARVNAHILQAGIVKRIKRPFAPVFLILDECLVLHLNLYTLLYI